MKDLHVLPKFSDRWSHLYLDHCRLDQDAAGLCFWDQEGKLAIPIDQLALVMLGPGTAVTHAAMKALAENNCLMCWVGEYGVRVYAHNTGGTHSAALSDGKDILVFREDIGRHNAIDKVVGYALVKNVTLKNTLLITSGRISSEVLFKVRKGGIPMVVSKSAPTNQAVKLAREMDITLIGFARGSRMNVYNGEKTVNGKE